EVVGDADRWGGGQILIERVELLDPTGGATTKATTDDGVTIRIHYTVQDEVPPGAFGLAITDATTDTLVWGGNTGHQGLDLGVLTGSGAVDWTTPSLPLQPGVYDIDVSATDRSTATIYDYRRKVLRFDVQPGDRTTGSGLVALSGSWALRSAAGERHR
ncbi:MAG: transporter ATP-binding protein, partial [Frankiales bacterium]|nr:transporter ATP-binding protein [Frankiales bacterium]